MKLPLVVFSLLLIALLFAIQALSGSDKWRKVLDNTLPVYVLLAVYALLSITFIGKPGLGPQYLAWLILALQVLRSLVILRDGKELWVRAGGVLIFATLAYLWFLQLPFFNALPV